MRPEIEELISQQGTILCLLDADDYIEKGSDRRYRSAQLTEDDIELIITGIKMNYIKNGQTMTIEEYRLKDETFIL